MTFEIALTGINAASTELEVIANNIANNKTNGFKRSRAEFADVYSSSALGVAGGATGSGVKVVANSQEFSQGNVTFTDNNMDLSISGEGFFRMNDHGSALYSRAGTFGFDNEGYVVSSSGANLTGYTADISGTINSTLGDLRLDQSDLSPNPTTEMTIGLNLDTKATVLGTFDATDTSTYNYSTSTTIYDSLGTSHEATMYFHKDSPNEWSAFTYVAGTEVSPAGGDKLVFTTDGQLDTVNGAVGTSISSSTFTAAIGAAPQAMTIDLGTTNQFDNPFGVSQITQNGFSVGRLQDVQIDDNGIIFGRYSNRESKALGQIALSNFTNPQGLAPIGGTGWAKTLSSGIDTTGAPGTANLGFIQSGALEESNVDLTKELVAMIGAQRSFQANAQVISTADTVTQTIINIR